MDDVIGNGTPKTRLAAQTKKSEFPTPKKAIESIPTAKNWKSIKYF
jgi:hypothetical protein